MGQAFIEQHSVLVENNSEAMEINTWCNTRNLIKFMDGRNETVSMHCDLGRSIVFTSMWTMDDTLRCHAYVRRSVHRGTTATSTNPGLIFPVLSFALGRRMVKSQSRPILP